MPFVAACQFVFIRLAFITSFFELGTSLSLPAMGALAVQVQGRFDCNDAKIGELVAWCAALPFLDLPLPSYCLSLIFHCLCLTYHCL